MPQTSRLKPEMYRQKGYGLLLMLAFLGLSMVFFVGSSLTNRLHVQNAGGHPEVTARALQQAKEALIGYAATYRDKHPGDVFGYLPVPDLGSSRENNIGCDGEGCTAGSATGILQDMSVIGRLPWQSLNLPPLRDEYGECLWYALSGSHQSAHPTATMNWDTVSYLDLYTGDGTNSLTGGDVKPHQRPVAVIFSAGPPLPGQSRARSGTDSVEICGGNYNVRNYLDPYTADSPTSNLFNWFSGANIVNSSTDPGVLPPSTPKKLIAGNLKDANGAPILNDRAVYITSADIFKAVKQRSDFIQPTLAAIQACLQAYTPNFPMPRTGTDAWANNDKLHRGSLPAACASPNQTALQYASHFFYVVCDNANSSCIHFFTAGNNNFTPCKAAAIFGGERDGSQSRATSAERNNPNNFLQAAAPAGYAGGNNQAAYAGGNPYLWGNTTFLPADSATDVVICLQ